MSQRISDKILGVYLDKTNVGFSLFTPSNLGIQCSQFQQMCYLDYQRLSSVFKDCSKILTNQPKHDIFLTTDHPTIVNEKIPDDSTILNLIKRLRNPPQIFVAKCMSDYPLRYRSLGLILGYLFQHTDSRHTIIGNSVNYSDIEYFIDTLLKRVYVTEREQWFLQLHKKEIHPSVIKGNKNSKEGFSLLNLFESIVRSNGGKRVLHSLYFNPTYDAAILTERMDLWEWVRDNMKNKEYQKLFNRFHSLEFIIQKMSKAKEEEQDWRKLIKTIDSMCQLRQMMGQPFLPPFIEQYLEDQKWEEFINLRTRLVQAISLQPFSIRENVNNDLDQYRRTYDELPTILTRLAERKKVSMRNAIPFRIVFMAQLGYLLRVDPDVEEVEEEWRLQFVNGLGRYYRDQLTQQLDQEYGDVFGCIQDIERRILLNLAQDIVASKPLILKLYWHACYIECLWSVSRGCNSFCRPRLSSQSLVILNGWHILLGQTAVQNHIFSFPHQASCAPKHYNSESNIVNSNYSNRLMLMSGPNGSGKTAYLKQMAIMLYLTHLGFFLPAQGAEVPLIDRIAVVLSEHSIYEMSGFERELQSLATVLNQTMTTSKSVVLIDQLAVETDYRYALKTLYATVKCLQRETEFGKNRILHRDSDEFRCPLAIVVTHLTQVLHKGLLEEDYGIRYMTMDVTEDDSRSFKIRPGVVRKGYGIKTAAQFMSKGFIQRAQLVWEQLYKE